MTSISNPPPAGKEARFAGDFGQRFIVTVETEGEFAADRPLSRDGHGTGHITKLAGFQQFCEGTGVAPVYLVDWPVATSLLAVEVLGPALLQGKAEIGLQLNPWVTPPFEEDVNERNSFAGNLPQRLEAAKLENLRAAIEHKFGVAPLIHRAGRYGAGPHTAELLTDLGVALDSSVRPKFDYSAAGGPDFRRHPLAPYWLDETRNLLELPLTTVFWGMLRRKGDWLYPALRRAPRLLAALARLSLLERIPLTPEGVTVDEAIRGIDMALDDGLPLLVFSFHSPSLEAGHTPYVRDAGELDSFYDWWRRVLTYLDMRGVKPTGVRGIMDAVER